MPRQSKLATSQINQLVSSAITAGAFPLTIIRPEDEKSCNPISLFERKPRFVWAPEAKVGKFCWQCNKKLNGAAGYQAREVQDIEHSYRFVFCQVQMQQLLHLVQYYLRRIYRAATTRCTRRISLHTHA